MLPPAASGLRLLEDAIGAVFYAFGYEGVITPTLELESAIEVAGEQRFRRSFRLFDEEGDTLVLRQEMTTPIARLVATKMRDRDLPLRLCYFANAFRPTAPQWGQQSEFRQAGLELIGDDSPAADGEVLAVVCAALEACGLDSFSVGIGEASLLRALLDETGVGGEREQLFAALAARDLVEFDRLVAALDIDEDDRRDIIDMVTLRGGSEALARAQDLVRGSAMEAALKRLARTYYIVSRFGYAGRILFDFGITRDFDYYTGLVFEILSGGIGFPVGGGGRYDNLLDRFGRPAPAVGFAVGLERLQIAVAGGSAPPAPARRGLVLVGGLDEELDLACILREAGVAVCALGAGAGRDEALAAAAAYGYPLAAMPGGEGYELMDISGASRRVSRDELTEALGWRQ